nr:triple gene block protein 4 [Banmivirus BanMMV]
MYYQSGTLYLLVFIVVVLAAMYILDAIDNRENSSVCYIEVNGNRAFIRGCEINSDLVAVVRELKPVKFTN